jgi:hypothetical protein
MYANQVPFPAASAGSTARFGDDRQTLSARDHQRSADLAQQRNGSSVK